MNPRVVVLGLLAWSWASVARAGSQAGSAAGDDYVPPGDTGAHAATGGSDHRSHSSQLQRSDSTASHDTPPPGPPFPGWVPCPARFNPPPNCWSPPEGSYYHQPRVSGGFGVPGTAYGPSRGTTPPPPPLPTRSQQLASKLALSQSIMDQLGSQLSANVDHVVVPPQLDTNDGLEEAVTAHNREQQEVARRFYDELKQRLLGQAPDLRKQVMSRLCKDAGEAKKACEDLVKQMPLEQIAIIAEATPESHRGSAHGAPATPAEPEVKLDPNCLQHGADVAMGEASRCCSGANYAVDSNFNTTRYACY
jgi:hypothetical protein